MSPSLSCPAELPRTALGESRQRHTIRPPAVPASATGGHCKRPGCQADVTSGLGFGVICYHNITWSILTTTEIGSLQQGAAIKKTLKLMNTQRTSAGTMVSFAAHMIGLSLTGLGRAHSHGGELATVSRSWRPWGALSPAPRLSSSRRQVWVCCPMNAKAGHMTEFQPMASGGSEVSSLLLSR